MFIPPQKLKDTFNPNTQQDSQLRLQASHLILAADFAKEAFGDNLNVFTAFKADEKMLMIAPIQDFAFKKEHKAVQQMLKNRNAVGDKSIALHEFLIDNQLDETDRELTYELAPDSKILTVKL